MSRGKLAVGMSICLFLGITVTVCRADPMDNLVCTVIFETEELEIGLDEELCKSVANGLAAKLIEPVELEAMLAGKSYDATNQTLHRLKVRFLNPFRIAMVYEFGGLEEWRKNQQTKFDELAFDVMDAKIQREMFGEIAFTLSRLSGRNLE